MKTKQLLVWTLSILFLVSCSKTDVVPNVSDSQEISTVAAPTPPGGTSSDMPRKALVFIEPCSKNVLINDYLRSVNPATLGFRGFSNGIMMTLSNKIHFINYMEMPYWTNGQLPYVRQVDIPATTGGIDSFALRTYTPTVNKFKKIRLYKNVANENAWVTFVVPLIYASNVNSVSYCAVKDGKIVSNGQGTATTFILNNQIASYVFDYQGNLYPKGMYRVYTTYVSPNMRVPFHMFDYVEFRGL
jgi:hypothetical protein